MQVLSCGHLQEFNTLDIPREPVSLDSLSRSVYAEALKKLLKAQHPKAPAALELIVASERPRTNKATSSHGGNCPIVVIKKRSSSPTSTVEFLRQDCATSPLTKRKGSHMKPITYFAGSAFLSSPGPDDIPLPDFDESFLPSDKDNASRHISTPLQSGAGVTFDKTESLRRLLRLK